MSKDASIWHVFYIQAIDKLLSYGAKTVVITSTEVENMPGKLILMAKNKNGKYITTRTCKDTDRHKSPAVVIREHLRVLQRTQVSLQTVGSRPAIVFKPRDYNGRLCTKTKEIPCSLHPCKQTFGI